jgi:hypothetical protein
VPQYKRSLDAGAIIFVGPGAGQGPRAALFVAIPKLAAPFQKPGKYRRRRGSGRGPNDLSADPTDQPGQGDE